MTSPSPIDALRPGESHLSLSAFRRQKGPFSFVLEHGMLKRLRLGNVEVARRIYFAVRDDRWATICNKISDVKLSEGDDFFEAAWSGRCRDHRIDYEWRGRIRILACGSIVFRVEGTAAKTFKTPRIGLCLLLSTDSTLGKAFEIVSSDGDTEQLCFESVFKRTQLACRWTSLRFSPSPNVHAEYTIDGSYFDLEDQRNFGDVSYKAMAGLPFENQEALAGQKSEQVLTIQVTSKPDLADAEWVNQDSLVELTAAPDVLSGIMPQIGLGLGDSDGRSPQTSSCVVANSKIFLHAWLNCSSSSLKNQAAHFVAGALNLDRPLYLTLENLNSENLPVVASLLFQMREQGARFLQMDVPESAHPGLILLRTCAREARLRVPCGKRVASFKDRAGLLEAANSGADFLAWCGTPLSHQDDDETLLENAAVFSHQALTAKSFAPHARLTVGPMQLSREEGDPDPRRRGLIAGAFMASSVYSMAEGGIDRALLCDVMSLVDNRDSFSNTIARLNNDAKTEVLPTYYVVQQLISLAGCPTFAVKSSDPLRVQAFGVNRREGRVIVIVNQTPANQYFRLSGICEGTEDVWLCSLNESTYSELAATDQVTTSLLSEVQCSLAASLSLAPFSVNFLREGSS